MKISLKNIVVIILSGLILFSLAGCSANNNLKTPSPPAKAVKRAENQNKYVGKYKDRKSVV